MATVGFVAVDVPKEGRKMAGHMEVVANIARSVDAQPHVHHDPSRGRYCLWCGFHAREH